MSIENALRSEREQQEAREIIDALLVSRVFKSRNELARELGVSPLSVGNWIRGVNGISLSNIQRLRAIKRRADSMMNNGTAESLARYINESGVQQMGNGVAVNTGVQPAHSPHDVLHIYRDLLIKRVIEADFMDDATKFKVISLVQTTRLAGEQ